MTESSTQFSRNEGFIRPAEQKRLKTTTVAVAGVGGVGGRVVIELARIGIGKLKIADPDIFTITNLNRQEGCFHSTLGKSKVLTIASMAKDINPDIVVDIYEEGVTKENLSDFLEGVDIVIEATDFSLPHVGVMIARQARKQDISLIMGIELGFGATVTRFDPAGYSYERYLGLSEQLSLEDLENGKGIVDIRRWVPHVPNYGKITTLQAVANKEIEAPAIAPAVDICAALITTQVFGLAVGKKIHLAAPAIFHVDVREGRGRMIRFPMIHHYMSLSVVIIKSIFSSR